MNLQQPSPANFKLHSKNYLDKIGPSFFKVTVSKALFKLNWADFFHLLACHETLTFYETLAHGRMEMPAARNCAWRYGFGTPVNYNDLELNCGGLGVQHFTFGIVFLLSLNFVLLKIILVGGQCGVCGDSMHLSPRPHEAGGKYATGFIVKYYQIGDVIDVKIYVINIKIFCYLYQEILLI